MTIDSLGPIPAHRPLAAGRLAYETRRTRITARGKVAVLLGSVAAFGLFPAEAAARDCPQQGRLLFLGTTAGGANSVWLHATAPGDFTLQADGRRIDGWTNTDQRVRVTLSDVVSEGADGAHSLETFDPDIPGPAPVPCTAAVQLQSNQGGITLPPGINWPSARPQTPIGISVRPEHPIAIIARPRPPVGVAVKPAQPIGVTVRPETPVGIAIKPEQPVGIAVKPEQPVGIAVKPEQPVGIAVKPEQPVGIAVKPEQPVGIAVKPEQPVGIAVSPGLPGVAVGGQTATAGRNTAHSVACLEPGEPTSYDADGRPLGELCPRLAPLTEGRDVAEATTWTVWADVTHSGSSDNRTNLEGRSNTTTYTMGLDHLVTPDVAIGGSIGIEDGRIRTRGDFVSFSGDGIVLGPYAAWRISRNLVIDASYSYTTMQNSLEAGPFLGRFESERHSLSSTLSGQWVFGRAYTRPALSIGHQWAGLDAFDLTGSVLGRNLTIAIGERDFETGSVEFRNELGAVFPLASGGYIAPWAELGVLYNYQLDAELENTIGGRNGDVSGSVRAGLRAALTPGSVLELGAGYLSIGQSQIDRWEVRALVSFGF